MQITWGLTASRHLIDALKLRVAWASLTVSETKPTQHMCTAYAQVATKTLTSWTTHLTHRPQQTTDAAHREKTQKHVSLTDKA